MSLSEMTEDEQRHIGEVFREAHGYELNRADLERGMEVAKLAFCLLPATPGRGEDTVRFDRSDGKCNEAPAWLVELLGKFDRAGAETERERDAALGHIELARLLIQRMRSLLGNSGEWNTLLWIRDANAWMEMTQPAEKEEI